jgi:hypothetical protein
MTHIRYALAGIFAAGLITTATPGIAGQDRSEPSVGSTVALSSCVAKGQKDDTFVLTDVADVPVHPATKGGKVVYWIDKVEWLKPHVGHQIRLTGTITDVDKQEIEVKTDGKGGAWVEIEGAGKQVKTTTREAGLGPANPNVREMDIPTTLVRLKVAGVTMVSERCTVLR